jgi:sugar phosphate permease
MIQRDRSRWFIVAVLFVTLFFIWGPVNAGGVFFLPLLRSFGWSRAQLAVLGGTAAIAGGVSGPFVGWLIDRAGVRAMMIGGATAIVLCDLALSRANSLAAFAMIFVVAGMAFAAATLIPCSIVIANWFASERGLAMGIVFAGIPLGGTGITILASYVVSHYGWRVGYVAMGLPVAAIVIPALAVFLRERPSARVEAAPAQPRGVEPDPIVLSGLEVREALKSRSFWMIAVAQLMFNTAWVGMGAHFIPYLVGEGYTPSAAAEILSAGFVLSAAGSSVVGLLADRLSARMAMALVCVSAAAGITALFAAARGEALAAYLLLFATISITPAALMPLVIAESLGFKRLGTMLGVEGIFATMGFAAGPVIAGRIYDVTGSYSDARGCSSQCRSQPPWRSWVAGRSRKNSQNAVPWWTLLPHRDPGEMVPAAETVKHQKMTCARAGKDGD